MILALVALAAAPVVLSVDPNAPVERDTSRLYGINGFAALEPDVVERPAYRANLAAMRPGLFRIHHANLTGSSGEFGGWVDEANRRWDEAKIRRALARPVSPGAAVMINLPRPPAWLKTDPDGFLARAEWPAYAAFCADLVRIAKGTATRVALWEVPNEPDMPFYAERRANGGYGDLLDPARPEHVEDVAELAVLVREAIQQADPSARVGGPAAARADLLDYHRRFAKAARGLDFYSVHAYASGSATDSDAHVFDRAQGFGPAMAAVKKAVHPLPLYLDEYNVSWTWETRDPRMTNAKGAVFDALVIRSLIGLNLAGAAAWNERDGVYGKTDGEDRMRPGGRLFALLNLHARGRAQALRSSSPAVAAFLVNKGKAQTLVVVNRSPETHRLRLPGSGWRILGAVGGTATPSTLASCSVALYGRTLPHR